MNMNPKLKPITQLYKFESGETIWVISYSDMPKKYAVKALQRSARLAAEDTWKERYPNKPCPPGRLVGKVINGDPLGRTSLP